VACQNGLNVPTINLASVHGADMGDSYRAHVSGHHFRSIQWNRPYSRLYIHRLGSWTFSGVSNLEDIVYRAKMNGFYMPPKSG
jgi:hypothetical protein